MEVLQTMLGDPVVDPEEDAFLAFAQDMPSHSLGFVDSHASDLVVAVPGRGDLVIKQSRSLLTSNRKGGTTGAVLWKVTPLLAEWLASSDNMLFSSHLLGRTSTVLELGVGTSGVIALALAPRVGRYIATDQDYALRLLKQNIAENLSTCRTTADHETPKGRKGQASRLPQAPPPSIETMQLDWETDSVASLPELLDNAEEIDSVASTGAIDMVIASDCIYNEALIEPLNNTCAHICRLRTSPVPAGDESSKGITVCLIAQQLRSYEVFETWLRSFHRLFHVWQVPDRLLITGLRQSSGYIVHVGIVRS